MSFLSNEIKAGFGYDNSVSLQTDDGQSITKKHVPPVSQPYVFPVYLRNRLSYKKSIYSFLYQFLKSSQLEQKFFKSDDTIS